MTITAIKQQLKRSDRYSIYVDGVYAFSLSESGLLEQGLASGQELTTSDLEALKKASGTDKAYGNALRYAALRPRSEWEMATYLRHKKIEEPVAEDIMQRLQRLGLLDDAAFARAWVAHRRALKSVSKRRLQLELTQKHVSAAVIATSLEEDDVSEGQALQALISKKQSRYPDRIKFMQYLARQGFGYDDIRRALDDVSESTP